MKEAQKKVHEEALKRYKLAEEAWAENHRLYKEDVKFRAGDQWPEAIKKAREKQKRPLLVVDKLNQYIRQVVNDGRQNRPSVKVRPIDDYGDEEVAEALQGIIRHICDRSNADEAFDTALDCAASGGFGYFRVLTSYVHENTFNQDIDVVRIRNPLSVLVEPGKQAADGSDIGWAFIVDDFSKEDFKARWPKAEFSDWKDSKDKYKEGWAEDQIRVAEYWYKEDATKTLHLLENGTTATDEEYKAALAEGIQVPAIIDTREISCSVVKWCRLSGAEILEENDWLGKHIPIIPVFGNEYDLEGKVIYSGLIRAAKDPQRLYNYSRSAYAERVALTPKSPYVVAADGIADYPEWEDANTGNYSALRFKHVDEDGNPIPQPFRVQASDIPSGFAQDMELSEHDIQASMGMYAASLGQQSNEKSGKAIMARQREGDTATFHFQDNLNRGVRYLGRILVDLIPKYYDSRRVVRILGEDGEAEEAIVDPESPKPKQIIGGKAIYNLGVGTYDVSVSAGPSYTTKRQEAAEAMIQLTQANPALMQVIGDIMVRNMDWPGADDIADRLKLMLPPNIQEAESNKGQASPEVQAVKAQAQQMLDQMSQRLQEMQQLMAETQQAAQEREAAAKKLELENAALKASMKLATDEAQVKSIADQVEANQAAQEAALKQRDLEFELKQTKAMQALEDIQEQTIEQIKALLEPEPAKDGDGHQEAEQPQPTAPSPDLMAILEHYQAQTNAILEMLSKPQAPKTKVATLSDGRQIRIQEE